MAPSWSFPPFFSDPIASSNFPRRAASRAACGSGMRAADIHAIDEEADDRRRHDRRAIECLGPRHKRNRRLHRQRRDVRGGARCWRCAHDPERPRHFADFAAGDGHDRASDVLAGGQQHERQRSLRDAASRRWARLV